MSTACVKLTLDYSAHLLLDQSNVTKVCRCGQTQPEILSVLFLPFWTHRESMLWGASTCCLSTHLCCGHLPQPILLSFAGTLPRPPHLPHSPRSLHPPCIQKSLPEGGGLLTAVSKSMPELAGCKNCFFSDLQSESSKRGLGTGSN